MKKDNYKYIGYAVIGMVLIIGAVIAPNSNIFQNKKWKAVPLADINCPIKIHKRLLCLLVLSGISLILWKKK